MAAPTATEIRNELEGYGITSAVLSDGWIERCRDEEIIPHIEDITRMTFSDISTVTEYYNGNGQDVLILNRRPVNSITSIEYVGGLAIENLLSGIDLIGDEGMIKSKYIYDGRFAGPVFPRGNKNIKVTYTYGTADYPTRIFRAIKNLVAAKMLLNVGNRTGGGDLGVQQFSRSYGEHGKYTHKMKELVSAGYALLKKFQTGVTGG